MGIIADLEALYKGLQELMPLIDAMPLSPSLAALRAKLDEAMAMLKASGI